MGTHVREQETLVSTALPAIGRRALVGGALAALAAPALAQSAPAPDPIFAAIAEHAQLWRAVEVACRAESVIMKAQGAYTPAHETATNEVEAASLREGKALLRFLATVPATPAGLLAYLDHLGSPMGFGEEGPSEQEFPAILRTVRAFAEATYA
ncbi:hypothetical protein [Xanthobacter autotrophicus]|uniref:hypothetical protein n=1 Tax=Xanthobacter autotrophicus TaxID=280 RepID=UPI0037274E1C